jgi:hypothetical protein
MDPIIVPSDGHVLDLISDAVDDGQLLPLYFWLYNGPPRSLAD